MNMENRLDSIEETQLALAADAMALDVVIQALIGTHPDPEMLRGVLKHLFAEREQRIRDLGFDRGYLPKTAGATADGLRKRAEHWLQFLPGEPEDG